MFIKATQHSRAYFCYSFFVGKIKILKIKNIQIQQQLTRYKFLKY